MIFPRAPAGGVTVDFAPHTTDAPGDVGMTLLEIAERGDVPVGAACGGVGACATCHVYVTAGEDLLSEPTDAENDTLDKAFDARGTSRLACQACVRRPGKVCVTISREALETYEREHPNTKHALPLLKR